MASKTTLFLTLLLLTTVTATASDNTTAITTVSPSQPPLISHKQAQQNTIIDAIIGATDFSNWANLLAGADISTIPLSATLFVSVSATKNRNNNPDLLLPSHIVPRRLSFSELQLFPVGARLPTLLPGNILRITNNSAVNFTINDGVKLVKPDMYQNAIVSVHGVSGFHESESDFRVSGVRSRRNPRNSRHRSPDSRHRSSPVGNTDGNVRPAPAEAVSGAVKGSCSWGQIVVVVLTVLLVLHVLGLPSLEIGCRVVNGPAKGTEGSFRYYAGCTWKFFN